MDTQALQLFTDNEEETLNLAIADLERVEKHVGSIVAIRSQQEATTMHNGLSETKRIEGQCDYMRRKMVDPLNKQVSTINGVFRAVTDRLKSIESRAKRHLLLWKQAEDERIAKAQAEARRQQEEAAEREAEALAKANASKNSKSREKHLAEAAQASQALVAAREAEPMNAPRAIKTEHGTSGTRMVWTFRITDVDKVPARFKVIDERLIRRAIAEGARQLEGIEIFEEEVPYVRVAGGERGVETL